MALTIERHIQGGFSILFLLLCVVGAMSYYSVGRLREDAARIAHTHEVIAAANALDSAIADAISAERGYALTGEDVYLEQHRTEARGVQARLTSLQELVTDDPSQRERLKALAPLVAERMNFIDQVNELRRSGGLDAVRVALATGKGRSLDNRISALTDDFEAAERSLLRVRAASAAGVATAHRAVILASGALALASVMLAFYLLTRDFAGRRRAEAALRETLEELETRVRDRTVELAQANESMRSGEERLRGIIESAMDAIITVDKSQNIVLFNAAAERIFRCPDTEAIGLPLERFIPERFRSSHHRHIEQFGANGSTTRMMGARLALSGLRADGEEFPIDASISQVTVDGEKFYTVILRDSSERVRAEAALQRSHQELREMSAVMNEAREAERTRIARELHDELAQWLTAIKMDMAWVASRLPPEHEPLIRRTEKMRQLVDTTVMAVRRIAADLRPVMLDDLGLVPSIEHLLHTFSERANVAISLEAHADEMEFLDPLTTSIYRMIQEALTNVARHAAATAVEVTLALEGGALLVRVRDNGRGLGSAPAGYKSYGLLGIKERAQTLGGKAEVYSPPEGGTVVEIRVPIERYRKARVAT